MKGPVQPRIKIYWVPNTIKDISYNDRGIQYNILIRES